MSNNQEPKKVVKNSIHMLVSTSAIAGALLYLNDLKLSDSPFHDFIQYYLATPTAAVIAYLASVFIAKFIRNPKELLLESGINRQIKHFEGLLKKANKNPSMFTEEQIADYQDRLHQLNMEKGSLTSDEDGTPIIRR